MQKIWNTSQLCYALHLRSPILIAKMAKANRIKPVAEDAKGAVFYSEEVLEFLKKELEKKEEYATH